MELNIVQDLPPQMTSNNVVAIDLEIFGMNPKQLHRPNGQFASLQIDDGKATYVITDENKLPEVFTRIEKATHVFHNAKFDIFHLRRWCKYPDRNPLFIYDTMLFEKILGGGLYDTFSLKALARRYLNYYLDKKEREDFVTSSSMSRQMIEYGAMDAKLTREIYLMQQDIATEADCRIWNYIDCPALFAILDFKGFTLDTEAWASLADRKLKEAEAIQSQLNFNVKSPKQVLDALRSSGLKKLNSTDIHELIRYKEYPLVKKVIECRNLYHMASTYGDNVINNFVEADGKIYPDVKVIGAETGRMSCADPNLQNQPKELEYRSCYVASPGHILLVADYNAQEPRITAYLTQDGHLIEATKSKLSIHLSVGRRIFHKPDMRKTDPLYKKAKSLNLGLTYGMTAQGLMNNINANAEKPGDMITYNESEKLLAEYFKEYPDVKNWITNQRKIAEKQGYIDTVAGRRIWLNLYSYQWMNNAINGPEQGGAADMTKRALVKFREECLSAGIEYPVVVPVHDEIVCDPPDEQLDLAKQLLEKSMVEEAEKMFPGIPFSVETSMGKNWACKQ
jgi:DNA polymerase I-like protein with 3'-5' exonuclease and polymerase domains